MINWLTAIFGFLAAYSCAALIYALTRPEPAPESWHLMLTLMVAAIAAAFVNEWRARRAARKAARLAASEPQASAASVDPAAEGTPKS